VDRKLPKTSELSEAHIDETVDEVPEHALVITLRQCPECRLQVREDEDKIIGHRLTCQTQTARAPVRLLGWHVSINMAMLEEVVQALMGLEVQILGITHKGQDIFWLTADPGEWEDSHGPWDLCEAFMRLGFLPPAEIAQELREIPAGGHSWHRLWTIRGARRTMRKLTERAEAAEKRIVDIQRKMFPRGKIKDERQPELPMMGLTLGLDGEE